MESYEILKFASLFHEIGKFHQRADSLNHNNPSYDSKYNNLDEKDYGKSCDYVKWSANFVKDYFNESVENLVLFHQKPENSMDEKLCNIIKKASFYSSSENIDLNDERIEESFLTSIFSKINLNDEIPDEKYLPLVELDFNNDLTPKTKLELSKINISGKYLELWGKFIDEINNLKYMDFETLLAIVKKYTSTIPLNSFKNSDISLFNHLKTTTAISNCLYLFSNENELLIDDDTQETFRIINGDISGIQDFIYKISSPDDEAQRGMNKRLMGRSLYLTLLNESIVDKIIKKLDLDSSNIIFCGGGRFTILAPNTSETDEVIEKINREVNKHFIDQFNAELYLALESISVSGEDLQNFDSVIRKLNNLLNNNKKHKFSNLLDYLFDFKDEFDYELCPICGNPIDNICEECRNHENLGQQISNAQFLIKYYGDNNLNGFKFFDTNYIFEKSNKNVAKLLNSNSDTKFIVYRLNDSNFLSLVNKINNENVSFDFKVLGNNVPNIKMENKTLFFNHLAEISKGSNKLGILKMDVDNLGLIFSSGFNNVENAGISRISSLSFYLDLFFSGYINKIASRFKVYSNTCGNDSSFSKIELDFISDKQCVYKAIENDIPNECEDYSISTIHINYSGGDDLLVVGPYDDIIEFSQEFRNEFKKWTAENDSINISGGIFICGPKFPIGKAALLANDELEKSKGCGKNKITLFNEVLNWESNGVEKGFDELFDFANYLESKVGKGISKSFVYSLLNIWQKTSKINITPSNDKEWEYDLNNRLNSKEYMRYFKYKLRIIKKQELREEIDKKGVKYMPWIKTPVSWVSLRLR